MKNFCIFSVAILLAACAGPKQSLTVKQFQLRDPARNGEDEPMSRMEKERRLLGAVSEEQRRQRLGQYYTVLWNDPSPANSAPVEVVFFYQQGKSASRVKQMKKRFPAGESKGKAEFAVIGNDYFDRGRVLAWQLVLKRGERVIATKQSYLWQ